MAVSARVKFLDAFALGSSDGPPLVYLDVSIGDKPPRRLHIEVRACASSLDVSGEEMQTS